MEAPRKELVNAPLSTAPRHPRSNVSPRAGRWPRAAAPDGIFRGLFGHDGRGAAAAAEAAAQERSRVRRRVSESPGFFERTGHAMDTYLTPPRRGQHPQ